MKFADSVKQVASLTSTSTITLGAATIGFRTLAQAIIDTAGKPEQVAVGDTICMRVDDAADASKWEIDVLQITGPAALTRLSILSSSAAGAAVTFGGSVSVLCTAPASYLTGQTVNALPTATLADAQVIFVTDSSGNSYSATLAALKAYTGGAPADTTAPTVPTGLNTSSVTQNAATMNWTASTDNSGVAPTYEASKDGSSWTAVSALTYGFTGLQPGTLYTLQVRAVDGSGNRSAAASIQVTTAAASGDTTAPTMSGSITSSNITQTGLTMAYTAGADNVGVAHYDVSVDTGTASWVNNGLNLSYGATGLTAGTPYTERVRAVDAAGNVSNVLTASATTSAASTGINPAGYVVRIHKPDGVTLYDGLAYFPSSTGNSNATLSGTAPNGFTRDTNTAVWVLTPGGVAPAGVKFVWSKSFAVPPIAYADTTLPANSANGNTIAYADAIMQGGNIGNWTATDTGNKYYGGFFAGTEFVRGAAGTYYLWAICSDGSSAVYTDGTGSAIGWTVTGP